MPTIPIPYDTALSRHPEAVAEVVAKIHRGKARSKNTDPATWAWSYSWATQGTAYSFTQLLDGTAQKASKAYHDMTLTEKIADQEARTVGVCLVGSPARTTAYSEIGGLPPEIKAWITKVHTEQAAEEARVAALSPEQREAELQEALRELRKGRGFVEIKR